MPRKPITFLECCIVFCLAAVLVSMCVHYYVPREDRAREQWTLQNARQIQAWAKRYAKANKGLFPHGVHMLSPKPDNPFGGGVAVKDGRPPYVPEEGTCYYEVSRDRRECTLYVYGRNGRKLEQYKL